MGRRSRHLPLYTIAAVFLSGTYEPKKCLNFMKLPSI